MNIVNTIYEVELEKEAVFIVHEKFERTFNKHQHSKGQLSYVEDGIAYISIENQQFVIPAKHFVWIPKNIPHELKVAHSATQLHSIYFPVVTAKEDPFYEQFGIYPANNLIIELIRFTERWNKQSITSKNEFSELLFGLFHILSEEKNKQLSIMLPFSDDAKMIKIINYVEQYYGTNLSIEMMTQHFNMSERTFTRWFKKELGITFKQYVKSVRITKAIEFLLKTNLSISEIANKVGYDSLPSFSKIFHEFTGKRPHEMRKELK